MNNKKGLFFVLIGVSIGYLIYNFLSVDYEYGIMMNHHGYYDNYSSNLYYLNSVLVFLSYFTIIISTIILLSNKSTLKKSSMTILDQRLSKGEISIEEYLSIKTEISK